VFLGFAEKQQVGIQNRRRRSANERRKSSLI